MTPDAGAPPERGSAPLPERIGQYRVLSRISSGGMGELLSARKDSEHGFEKNVAIKLIHSQFESSERSREAFFREARLAAKLSHPNVCQVFDFGVDEGLYYIVMEYLEGIDLAHLFAFHRARRDRLPQELAGRIIADAATGLHHAHRLRDEKGRLLGVVHRDVSPQNLLVTNDGCTKVLDFGVAKTDEQSLYTQANLVRGKPGYMSPEQAQNDKVDARADVFSLGVVLFELLTGKYLFMRETVHATFEAVLTAAIPAPQGIVPDLDLGLAEVVRIALSRDRDERFANALAMSQSIETVLAKRGRPVTTATLAAHVARVQLQLNPDAALVTTPGLPVAGAAATPAATPTIPERLPRQPIADAAPAANAAMDTESLTAPTPGAAQQTGARRWRLLLALIAAAAVAALALWQVVVHPSSSSQQLVETAAAVDAAVANIADATPALVLQAGAADAGAASLPAGKKTRARPHPVVRPPDRNPVATEFGALTVTATPYGLVRVDGTVIGPTPIVRHRLPIGEHLLEVIAPDTGAIRHRQKVAIGRGATTTVQVK